MNVQFTGSEGVPSQTKHRRVEEPVTQPNTNLEDNRDIEVRRVWFGRLTRLRVSCAAQTAQVNDVPIGVSFTRPLDGENGAPSSAASLGAAVERCRDGKPNLIWKMAGFTVEESPDRTGVRRSGWLQQSCTIRLGIVLRSPIEQVVIKGARS